MYPLLKKLREEFKWEVLSVTDKKYEKTKKNKKFNKVALHTISHNNRELEIEKTILKFKLDIIITQLMWGDVVLRLANKYNIPSILRVCKIDYLITEKGFNPYKNETIFMFNPLERKGGIIFKEIAKRLSNNKFGTVFGWSSLKEKNNLNKFSKKYIKRITESEGTIFDGSLPR